MNLTSVKAVKEILAEYQVRPRHGLGQNFLVDSYAIDKLLTATQLGKEDTVLEIGPGIGTLTQKLAQLAKRVIAIEKDQRMTEVLKQTLSGYTNIEVIHGDALKADYTKYLALRDLAKRDKLPTTNYKLVANLPYYITAPVIRKFLETEQKPSSLTLIVQKEVAQRICAKSPKMSILAVSVQVYAIPKVISYIKKNSFWPQPRVDAAILQITPFPTSYTQDFPKFFTVVKAGFKQPRKQLVNNLSKELDITRAKAEQWLLANHIQPTQRAETLSVQDWLNLANTLQ